MEDIGLLTSAWKDLVSEEIGLKVMQVIALEAPGSERLKRIAVAVDEGALREYGRAVEHFLFPPKSPGKHATGEPERSLSDKEPDTIGPPFHFHASRGASSIHACCVDAPRSGEVESIERTSEGILLSQSFARWDHVKNGRHQENEPWATWTEWTKAFEACVMAEHWTGWITVGTQVRVHGQKEPQEIIASAYLFGHGGLPNDSVQWRIARRVQKLLIQQLIDTHEKQIIRQSRAAAVSRIMARCMSHNLGSHVLTSLTQPQSFLDLAVAHKGDEGDDKDRWFYEGSIDVSKSCIIPTGKKFLLNTKPDSVDQQLATFNRYLRTRMDFLADVATGDSPFTSGMWLKEDLLDPFVANPVLRGSITGMDNKKLEDWIIFEHELDDVKVAIPNDEQGAQAMFIILENMVRNSAKYGGADVEEIQLCVRVDTDASSPELLAIVISDQCDVKDPDELAKLVEDQNARIDKEMLESDGRIRPGSWGMLEMKIAACYLRGIDTRMIDDGLDVFKDYPLLKAVAESTRATGGDQVCLGYRIYLRKHREALVVVTNEEFERIRIPMTPLAADEHGAEGGQLNRVIQTEEGHTVVTPEILNGMREPLGHALAIISNRVAERDSLKLPWRKVVLPEPLQDERANVLETLRSLTLKATHQYLQESCPGPKFKVVVQNAESKCFDAVAEPAIIGSGEAELKAYYVRHAKEMCADWFEGFPSSHPLSKEAGKIHGLRNAISLGRESPITAIHFAEARVLPIMIVDERIQREAGKVTDPAFGHRDAAPKLSDLMEKCGMLLPGIDLHSNDLHQRREELDGFIDDRLKQPGFVVVHMGVMERAQEWKSLPDEKKEHKLKEWLAARGLGNEGKAGYLVFTSGRSRPEFLPKALPFVSYSLLARYTLEQRSKFHLTKLLIDSHAPRAQ